MTALLSGRALILFLATLCVAAFTTALRSHFSALRGMQAGMRLTAVLTLLGFLALWLRLILRPASDLWWLAASLLAASLSLFLWSVRSSPRGRLALAFDDDRPDFVLRSGAYAYVRHPFYVSYVIFWLGLGIARLDWLGCLFSAGMTLLYWRAASAEENGFAESGVASHYAAYREETGMFLPRLGYRRRLRAAGPCSPG